ncbi:MAG: protein kinase [Methylococcaceae bacterium]|nr:protein kinase [Methylococcaceae bacterium]
MSSQPPSSKQPDQYDDATRIIEKKAEIKPVVNHQYGSFNEKFQVEGVIGEGGVGRVYLAYDKNIGRRVAIKETLEPLTDNDSELKNSFIHEAKITGKLEHPGIIPIYELGGRDHYGPYYVMKYIKGITMEEQFHFFHENLGNNDFKSRIKLLDTLIDVCAALAYAHSKGVIHRDIKPQNIISGKFGETIILDWGLAQVINDEGNTQFYKNAVNHQQRTFSDLTSSTMVGTPRYMGPEQAEGQASKASDVYSLGVILFRIITGKLPYQGSADEVLQDLLSDKPSPSPFQFNPSAPAELVAICEKAMAKPEKYRFVDAAELLKQLDDYRSGRMVNVYSYSKKELLKRFFSRHKLFVIMFSLLLLVIITGASFSIHYAYQMNIAKNKAENALVSITTFSERAQKKAHVVATTISSNVKTLYTDLQLTADKISQLNQSDSAEEKLMLSVLHKNYPRFDTFLIRQAKSLSAESSLGWKTVEQKYDAPIAEMNEGRLLIIFRTPIYKDNLVERYLEAHMYPEQVIPALFPIAPVSDAMPQDIWVMRNDGLIIYDKNITYQGSNLFTDSRNKLSPSLLSFGQLTFSDDEGVGHYSFIEENQKIDKIASWDTVQFNETERWVIIVNYPYLVQDVTMDN